MSFNIFIFKVKWKIQNACYFLFQYPRILKYIFLSNCKNISGKPKYNQPTILLGEGTVVFGKNVNLGVNPSPNLYSGYGYIDARKIESYISIGNDCWINNNATIISDGAKIIIGSRCLIGCNVEITDSDFHELAPESRFGGKNIIKKSVIIEDNVFIGNNVTILKGVRIGENSVIGNRSVVTKNIPQNSIAVGNPCKVIKSL